MEQDVLHSVVNSGRQTILIVDDDPINRAVLRKIFSASYGVKEAVNGRQGLEVLLRSSSSAKRNSTPVSWPVSVQTPPATSK